MWKAIEGTEGYYSVNESGDIKNLRTGKVRKPSVNRDGYRYVVIWPNNPLKRKTLFVHRVVSQAFIEKPNLTVNHIDGDKGNNNVTNLEWVTGIENNKHAGPFRRNRPKTPNLTDSQVALVKADQDRSLNNQRWANRLGVSRYVIRDLRKGKTYKHVRTEG